MALTQISTQGIKDGTITGSDLATNIDLVDSQKIRIGTGIDFLIFHDASTNKNHIKSAVGGRNIQIGSQSYVAAEFVANNGQVQLLFNGNLKLATQSYGVTIQDNLVLFENDRIKLGDSADLQIYHNAGQSYIDASASGNTSPLSIRAYGNAKIDVNGGSETAINCISNGAVELYHNNSKKFETTSSGAFVTKELEIEGTAVNDFESGRIRFTENAHGFLGGYAHYDGNANVFYIGVHPTNDSTVGNDVNAIKINRESSNLNVELNYGGSKKFETTSGGAEIPDGSVLTVQTTSTSNGFLSFLDIGNVGYAWKFPDNNTVQFGTNHSSDKRLQLNNEDPSSHFHFSLADNGKMLFGASDDLQIYHDGSNSFAVNTGGQLLLRSTTGVQLGSPSGEPYVIGVENGQVELYHDNSKKFETTSDGITVLGGTGNDPILRIVNSTNATGNKAEIRLGPGSGLIGTQLICEAVEDFTSGANRSAKFTIQNRLNGTFENNLIISHTGQAIFGCFDNAGNHFRLFNSTTSNTGTMFVIDSSRNSTNGSYKLAQWGSTTAARFQVLDSGTVQNGNGVYQQISDETLKENIVDADSQWNDIKNIKIRKFNFKESVDPEKTTMIGVIAQEVELVSPNLVSSDISMQGGEEKEYKSFKQSILYMKAVKCLQEAMAKIEVLETEVAALKAG